MKKIFTLLILSTLTISTTMSQMRYVDEVFTAVTITTDVKYAENFTVITGSPVLSNLIMDVYEPTGDTESERPLIILAHAGSFLPKCNPNQLPLGDKEDSSIVEMCMQFAKRGYVAVAMEYRLGWNPASTDADVRAGTIMQAVYRSVQDMKACVRYFKLSANQSLYGIDTTRIVVAGSNSGGYTALTYDALDDTSEVELLKFRHSVTGNPFIDMNIMGDQDGRGGMTGVNQYENAGPSSDAHLVLNMGGAMADTSWQEVGDIPIISFHGIEDVLTPYKTAIVIVASTGQPVIEVSGSHDLSRYATALGNQDLIHDMHFNDAISTEAAARTPHKGLFPFPGAANGYEPWSWYDSTSACAVGTGSAVNPGANKTKALAYIDTIMSYFCPRAVQALLLPGNTVGINSQVDLNKYVSAYPNPANDIINVNSGFDVKSVTLYNVDGKIIWSNQNERNRKFTINVSDFDKGFYILQIETDRGFVNKKIVVN